MTLPRKIHAWTIHLTKQTDVTHGHWGPKRDSLTEAYVKEEYHREEIAKRDAEIARLRG